MDVEKKEGAKNKLGESRIIGTCHLEITICPKNDVLIQLKCTLLDLEGNILYINGLSHYQSY